MTKNHELTKEEKVKRISRITGWRNNQAEIPYNKTYEEFYLDFMAEVFCKRCGVLYPDESITHHTHKKNLTADMGIMCFKCNIQTKQPNPSTYNKKKSYPIGIYGTRVR